MTIQEKYEELLPHCGKYGRIFKDVGIQNPQGGWYRKPGFDPDHDYEIPMLRIYAVMPNTETSRLSQLKENGWEEFKPEPIPEGVKKTRDRKPPAKKAKQTAQ